MNRYRPRSDDRLTGYENLLSIIEKRLDEDLEWIAREPGSAEARELVAEWVRLRRNLLQAGATCVRSRRRKGESDRTRVLRETYAAALVAAGQEPSDAEQTSTQLFDEAAQMGALDEGACAAAESHLIPDPWSHIPVPPRSGMH